jgi:hypothetical protein
VAVLVAVGSESGKKYFVKAGLLADWTTYPTSRSGWSERENLCGSDSGLRARVHSTTLEGMECHNSSGAYHRAYCDTNDCVSREYIGATD